MQLHCMALVLSLTLAQRECILMPCLRHNSSLTKIYELLQLINVLLSHFEMSFGSYTSIYKYINFKSYTFIIFILQMLSYLHFVSVFLESCFSCTFKYFTLFLKTYLCTF